MFTLVAVVCTGVACFSWSPPEIFRSAEACDQGLRRLYMVAEDAEEAEDAKGFTVVDVYCHQWSSGV